MKVYSVPKECPFDPKLSFQDSGCLKNITEAEEEHHAALKKFLIDSGYTGSKTGHELRMPMADSYASYMFVDTRGTGLGIRSFLIHLPYGDAWHSRDVEFLPQAEVLKRLVDPETRTDMFAAKKETV